MKPEKQLYQWDVNQYLTELQPTAEFVDYTIGNEVIRLETDGTRCRIPDEVLQTYGGKTCYERYPDGTYRAYSFTVLYAPKPPDYVYTPEERTTFESLTARVDAAIDEIKRRADSGEFTPVKGVDYLTDAEKVEMMESVSSGAVGEFREVVNSATADYNANAAEKLTTYDTNAEQHTTDYNRNAEQKLEAYNQNADNRVAEFDSHTEQIQTDINWLKSDLDYLVTTVCGKNLLNVSSCEANKYLNGNGTLVNYNGRYVTDFIPVEQGMKLVGTYTLWGKQNLYDFSSIVLYDINKNLVSGGVYNTNKYTIPSGVSYVRCTINVNLIDYSGQIELTEDGTPTPYEPYVEPYKKLTDEVIEKSNLVTKEYVDSNLEEFILCSLPSKMYVLEGRTIEIYNSQVLLNSDNFDLSWSSNLGIVRFNNRIRYTMGSGNSGYAGYIDLTIIKNEKIIATKRTELYRVPMPSSNVYAMAFGDSLTNHCVWESEIMNICNDLSFVGSRSRTIKDSDGENRLVYDEGRAGFTTFDYTSGKSYTGGSDGGGDESVNRWYDGTKFSASYYFANHFPIEQIAPTSFNFFLGMNDLMGSKTIDEIIANVKVMLDDIISYNNTLKISVCSPQLRWGVDYNEQKRFMQFAVALEELCKKYSNVVYVPLIACVDSSNNYTMIDVPINSRSEITEKVASDITHPANSGYWQMADLIVGAILR